MGIIRCSKHGTLSFSTHVCEHIREAVSNETDVGSIITSCGHLGYFMDDPAAPLDVEIIYCPTCVREREYPAENSVLSEHEFEQIIGNFKLVCVKCLNETLTTFGRDKLQPIK